MPNWDSLCVLLLYSRKKELIKTVRSQERMQCYVLDTRFPEYRESTSCLALGNGFFYPFLFRGPPRVVVVGGCEGLNKQ